MYIVLIGVDCMPIYEYICKDCSSRFEKLVKISDNGPQDCPECESKNVKKAFSTFGIGGCPNTGAKAETKKPPCGVDGGQVCPMNCG